ncbi:hypothetical protein EZV61_18205 [Corallincola luteus]|uniref:Uncharacterized protein n=1 Tax=Corallincola luteus TaxID=1775177 RepID=A0ABY2AFU6_9GAMM|nr:hypothetical protein [Corallincola luteus]TCI01325.1 hypothetical protein EZV61_18205 [Corallincola luteus]
MNKDQLCRMLEHDQGLSCSVCKKESKKHWTNSDGLENDLTKVGDVEPEDSRGYDEYKERGSNPFSETAPLSLSYYPYNCSSVYKCGSCHAVILIYLETGGHGARYQARWAQSGLEITP